MEDVTAWITGAVGAGAATVVAWARGWRVRRAFGRLITGAADLDEQTSKAVSVSIAALQAALNHALADHKELTEQVADMRVELAELRSCNTEYILQIDALKIEVTILKAENQKLRQKILEMGS